VTPGTGLGIITRVTESIVVRRCRTEDHAAVLALAPRLTIGVAPWRDPDAVREAVTGWIRDSLAQADTHNHAVLVAQSQDVIVGVVTIGTRRHFAGEVDAYVGELVVADGEERQGVGRLLMRAAEQWARDRGLRNLTLETGAANHGARAFYRSLGYLEEGVRLTKAVTPSDANSPLAS
jgi:ribosomal protein S18 acetylase RimI-like enzyme